MSPSAHQAFYQVAIALIPGLLFGGALLESRDDVLRSHPSAARCVPLRVSVVLLVVAAAYAEIVAVRGAIGGEVHTLEKRLVVFVVVVGTVVIGVRTAAPWVGDVTRRRRLVVGGIAALLALSTAAQLSLTQSISRAQALENLNLASERIPPAADAANDAHRTMEEARESLLRMLVDSPVSRLPEARRARLRSAVQRFIDAAASAAEGPRPGAAAFRRLNDVTDHARDAVRRDMTASDQAELLILAVERFSDAAAARATTRTNLDAVERSYRRSCREAAVPWCPEEENSDG